MFLNYYRIQLTNLQLEIINLFLCWFFPIFSSFYSIFFSFQLKIAELMRTCISFFSANRLQFIYIYVFDTDIYSVLLYVESFFILSYANFRSNVLFHWLIRNRVLTHLRPHNVPCYFYCCLHKWVCHLLLFKRKNE